MHRIRLRSAWATAHTNEPCDGGIYARRFNRPTGLAEDQSVRVSLQPLSALAPTLGIALDDMAVKIGQSTAASFPVSIMVNQCPIAISAFSKSEKGQGEWISEPIQAHLENANQITLELHPSPTSDNQFAESIPPLETLMEVSLVISEGDV